MKPATAATLLCCLLPLGAYAQAPAPHRPLAPLPASPEGPSPASPDPKSEPEAPPAKELLEVRVNRIIDEFNQRHEDRVLEMYSYGKAGDAEPRLKQFADPRRVEVELKDEEDREQTSKALAKEYADEANQVQAQELALKGFIGKRQRTLDSLSKQTDTVNRQDLELAAENLARQPGTDAEVSEIRRRLAEDESNSKSSATQRTLAEQEAASATDELKRLQALEESLRKESKAYTADAASAHQNQLGLADRLEFYVVNAQAEDVLDQDRKATASVHHLEASPEVQDTLRSLNPAAKTAAKTTTLSKCTEGNNDGKECSEKTEQAPKE